MATIRHPERSRCGRHLAVALLAAAPVLQSCGGDDELDGAPPVPLSVDIADAYPLLDFVRPLYFAGAPGDTQRIFVATQPGLIHVFANDAATGATKIFLDLRDRVTDEGNELGLLGLAFDPGYADNGYFYVNYNPPYDGSPSSPRRTVIARFRVTADPDVADPDSETQLLVYEQPFTNHNGGWLGFGPDGKLYIASGDGGGGGDPNNNAQNLNSLLGKILRIDADGSIPADNPFAGQPDRRGEIWAYGLRNPFRASFDRAAGALWAGDVGQEQWEEIDLIVRGGNYGWRKFEGNHVYTAADPDPGNATAPLHEYDHGGGRCSITGGYVYRGSAIGALIGQYVFADFCSGELWSLDRSRGRADITQLGTVPGNPSSFGEDADGELYITSFDGKVYKIVPDR